VATRKKKDTFTFFLHSKLYFHLSFSLVFFFSYARLGYFSWLKGCRSLQISKFMRSILSFLFSLYDEYEFFMYLFSIIV
jgi:hypothetical protein